MTFFLTSMDGGRPIPEDVVVDILLRLPVKSLLRFKCVRKNWCALIKSPSFIKEHFQYRNNNCARLLVCNMKMAPELHPIVKSVVFSLLPEEIVPGVTPEQKTLLQLQRVTDFTCVAGPVNGLFLVEKSLYGVDVCLGLWNPATKEFRSLPPAPFEIEGFLSHNNDHQYGLGFDMSTLDYKVVWIRVFWDDLGLSDNNRVYTCVYSSCNNSWRRLTPKFPPSSILSAPLDATYLNGVYYWLSRGLDGIFMILSFDMVCEQFGEMQVPDIPTKHWGTLTLHGGSLVMLTSGQPMTSIYDVWVMKQEGNWSKVHTIQPHIDAHWPINIWDNNKMVFENMETSQLVLYDPKTRRVTDLGFQLDPNIDGCWVFNYKESLVPIKRGSNTQGEDNAVKQIEHYFNTLPADEASS